MKDAARSLPYDHVDVAVAYGTLAGARLLSTAAGSRWRAAEKRLLISIDHGITHPDALDYLRSLPGSTVRVPNGRSVLASASLRPPTTFHAKAFHFRSEASGARTLTVGSANLSVSALITGGEVLSVMCAPDPATVGKWSSDFDEWFTNVWEDANDLDEVLEPYRSRFDAGRASEFRADDLSAAADAYRRAGPGIDGEFVAQLAVSRAFVLESGRLSRNRGRSLPGNQLDMPRGSRVFFGFTPEHVGRNHMFGNVEIVVGSEAPVLRSVRFGNNMMDKINLPVPEAVGLDTYDDTVMVFEGSGVSEVAVRRFRLTVHAQKGLEQVLSDTSVASTFAMHGGRRYGVVF